MAISDRLNKLTTDITSAYTSIGNKGGTIPANKNTNNLPTAIDSIEVIEQATAEGESLSLTNTKAMPYSDYVVEGKSTQEGEPSPDYPSDIHSVADDVNLFDIENTTAGYGNVSKEINDNHLILTATGTAGSQFVRNIISDVDSSKKYTLSFKAKKTVKGTDGESVIEIIVYGSNDDTNYTLLEHLRQNPVEGQEYSFNKTVTGYNYYRFFIYNNAHTPVTVGEKTEYWDIKLQEGTTATPYSPYNQGTVTIKQRGKNENDGINYGFYIGAEATTYRKSTGDNGICIPIRNQNYTISTKEVQARYRVACSNSLPSDTSQNCFNGVVKDGTNDNVTIDTTGYKYLLVNCTNINDIQIEQRNTSNRLRTISS